MTKTIIKLLLIYFKDILIKTLKTNFFKNLLKQILKTGLKKFGIYLMAKLEP